MSYLYPMNTKSKLQYSVNDLPKHKRILGTNITVDCFDIPVVDCSHFFLSHFHSDHYTKLAKSFKFPVYCSKTTANLVSGCIGAMTVGLDMYKNYNFDTFVVRLIDANHCPGAVCFIFLIDNQFILHTGDFRYNKIYHTFNMHFKAIYLDNTYENEVDFPTQKDAISRILSRFDQKNSLCPQNICVLCCSYRVGKEKIFLSVAEYLDQKIQVTKDKFDMYKSYSKYTVDKINRDVLEIVSQKKCVNNTFGFTKMTTRKIVAQSTIKRSFFSRNGCILPEPNIVKYSNESIVALDGVLGDQNKASQLSEGMSHYPGYSPCNFTTVRADDDESKPFDRFTMDEAPIKVVSMSDLTKLNEIISQIYADKVVVLIGSGWKEKTEYKLYVRPDGKKIKKGIEMVYFRYSEHSSPSELLEFKKSVSCDSIINTVRNL